MNEQSFAMIPISLEHEAVLAKAVALLREAARVAVLTGAGVSAESGVPTFRGSDGLWEGHRIDEVATPFAFHDNPRLVWRFYNLRRANLRTVQPNPGHAALAELERGFAGDDFTLITQNVDGLHRRAGSQRVLELHGNLSRTRCTRCHKIEDRGLNELGELPHCQQCHGLLRPDIVWFHEALPEDNWDEAALMTSQCDVFLLVGTSAVVYPAAGLIVTAKRAGAKVIEVNLAETDASYHADVRLLGPSGVLLPALLERLK
jgi:NAD-dependent deacetylase